jgi:hypothetical protein
MSTVSLSFESLTRFQNKDESRLSEQEPRWYLGSTTFPAPFEQNPAGNSKAPVPVPIIQGSYGTGILLESDIIFKKCLKRIPC